MKDERKEEAGEVEQEKLKKKQKTNDRRNNKNAKWQFGKAKQAPHIYHCLEQYTSVIVTIEVHGYHYYHYYNKMNY